MISAEEKNSKLILKINEPRIDMVIARKFRETLTSYIQEGTGQIIILDMSTAEYLDSSALGALVTFMKDVKSAGGKLVLCSVSRNIRTLLKLSRLDSIFTIVETLDQALAS